MVLVCNDFPATEKEEVTKKNCRNVTFKPIWKNITFIYKNIFTRLFAGMVILVTVV